MNAHEMSVSDTHGRSGAVGHADLQHHEQCVIANPFAGAASGQIHDRDNCEQDSPTKEPHVATAIEIIPLHEVPADPTAYLPATGRARVPTPDPDDLRQLVWIWVSSMISRGSTFRTGTARGLEVVRAMAAISFTDVSGRHHGPIATLPRAKDPTKALRDQGLDAPAIDALCQVAMAQHGTHAVLPPEVATAIVPIEYWPVLARFISDGPEVVWERFRRTMAMEAARPTRRKDRRRTGEASPRLSSTALRIHQVTFRAIMRALNDLKRAGSPSLWLKEWGNPNPDPIPLRSLNPDSFRADRTAPDLMSVRRAWRRLDEATAKKLSTKRGRKSARTIVRDRALIAVVLGTGMRIDAIARLRSCDFNPAHVFGLSGETGPAIRATPQKGRTDSVWKGVHPVVARCLNEYMDVVGISPDSTEPLWPSSHKLDSHSGNPAGTHTNSLALRVTGSPGRIKAFVPLPGLPGSSMPHEDPTIGFSPHTFRHLAEQFIFEAASDYLGEHPDERRFVTPQVIANAALDHAQTNDGLGYKDLDEPRRKEHLTRIGLVGLGEYIWGDRGARKAPDLLRVEAADRSVLEADAALADAKARRETLRAEQRTAMHVGDTDITVADLPTDELHVRLFEAQQISLGIDDLNDEIQQLTERLGHARLEAERARTTMVPVDDFEEVADVPDVPQAPAAPPRATRDRVTAAEAAEAFDVSPATMRRWFQGKMPHPAGDVRNPWDPGREGHLPDCILDLGPRSRWLVIDKLDPARIRPSTMAALRGS